MKLFFCTSLLLYIFSPLYAIKLWPVFDMYTSKTAPAHRVQNNISLSSADSSQALIYFETSSLFGQPVDSAYLCMYIGPSDEDIELDKIPQLAIHLAKERCNPQHQSSNTSFDVHPLPLARLKIIADKWLCVDVKKHVSAWLSGKFTNYGFVFIPHDLAYNLDIFSVDTHTVELRPFLLINEKFDTDEPMATGVRMLATKAYIQLTLPASDSLCIQVYSNKHKLIKNIYEGLVNTGTQFYTWDYTNNAERVVTTRDVYIKTIYKNKEYKTYLN